MHEDYFRAVESGATVITASRRLARVLRQGFHDFQRQQGHSVWNTPDILPWEAFLNRAWWRSVEGNASGESRATLLDPLQEQVVWEQVIRESPAGESLLRIPETAQQAMEAWGLMLAYRLPLDGRFEASEDWSAFAHWARAFRNRCTAQHWLEAARLADVVAGLAKSGELPQPAKLFLAGFEDLTPQQSELLDTLGGCDRIQAPSYPSAPEHWILRDSAAEIGAAAAWARRLLDQKLAQTIGVVVPNLTNLRGKVDQIFRETLDPGSAFDDDERAFHISLGPALDRYPVVSAALLMLEFAAGKLALPQAGMLLRSPFLGEASAEWTKRAQMDAKLRRDGVWNVTPAMLRDRAGSCPQLERVLTRFEKQGRRLAAEQPASGWSRDFSKLLETLEWPGGRTLSSREYQVVEKWQSLLSSLAALDVATAPMTFEMALSRLREFAAGLAFQAENEGAPVQIMGLLEASGLRFDHLWVMGLHDEALPAASNPNPFLPISLQREHQLPHSSAERELEFSTRLLDRLLGSARHAVLSYPATEGDRTLGPSPLVAGGGWRVAGERNRESDWAQKMRASAELEEQRDEMAPPVAVEALQPGGASLFKDMAACAFRAFAKYRLGAKTLERTDLGINKREQGTAAHRAMALLWGEIGSHARLLELTADEAQDVISRSVASAIEQLGPGLGRSLESRRLVKLMSGWLDLEKSRSPFTVKATEQQKQVSFGGLQIQTRADRIDRLANGREIILDYKTGILKTKGWEGDRPDEPQLPLYCATSTEPTAGAAFALMRIGELGFRGATEAGVSLPDMKKMRAEASIPFADQILEWKRVLERLAENYRAGLAEVDPKSDACDLCGLRALCRIREVENDLR